tara:strand:- start:881 stop:1390 length:510 start_codon:yes stop_codon:yes gene_type:complete
VVIWITGISGAGKTTIANSIIQNYKHKIYNLVNVDGDAVRELYGNDLGYAEKDRIRQIKRMQKLCLFLENQNLIVIASALYSNFELMNWNRKNFSEYFEIYLNASLELVKKRDPKGIYEKFNKGKEKNLVGIDIPWHEPKKPNLVIDMDKTKSVSDIRKNIIENLHFLN